MNWGPHRWLVVGDCWEWQGYRVRGYGIVGDGWHGKRLTHRVALEKHLGRPLGPEMQACHHCDNPPCVNPAHLYEGTREQNIKDQKERGRVANQNVYKTHCRLGHPLDRTRKSNRPSGVCRFCGTCERERLRRKTQARAVLEGKKNG